MSIDSGCLHKQEGSAEFTVALLLFMSGTSQVIAVETRYRASIAIFDVCGF